MRSPSYTCERRSHVLLLLPVPEMSVDARLHLYCVVVPRARYVLQAAFRRWLPAAYVGSRDLELALLLLDCVCGCRAAVL